MKEKLLKPVDLTRPCGKGLSNHQASRNHETWTAPKKYTPHGVTQLTRGNM
jgi:hypothetical protein